MGVYFCGPQECGELRPGACELRLFHESITAKPYLNPKKAKRDCRTCDSPFSYAISGSTEAIWNRPPFLFFHWMSSCLSSCRSSWPFR